MSTTTRTQAPSSMKSVGEILVSDFELVPIVSDQAKQLVSSVTGKIIEVVDGAKPSDPMAITVDLSYEFNQLTDEQLFELYGKTNIYLKRLEKWLNTANGVIKARLGDPGEPGTDGIVRYSPHFQVTLRRQVQMRLDTEAVKQEMGNDWYEAHCKEVKMEVLRVPERKDIK